MNYYCYIIDSTRPLVDISIAAVATAVADNDDGNGYGAARGSLITKLEEASEI